MPQPLAVLAGFPCEQPAVQSKQDPRKLATAAAAAAGSGTFHELITHLVLEHERVLARNGTLSRENARLRSEASAAPAPWDVGAGAAAAEAAGAEPADLPGFPFSTAGRPVLASERQPERAEVHAWLTQAGAPALAEEGLRPGPAGDRPGAAVELTDSWTQTSRGGCAGCAEDDCGHSTASLRHAPLARAGHEGAALKETVEEEVEERVVQAAAKGTPASQDEFVMQTTTVDEDTSLGSHKHAEGDDPDDPLAGITIQKRSLRRSDSMGSKASTTSVAVRRYSSNGRALSKRATVLYLLLEDADSSRLAFWYKIFMQLLLFVSVGTPLLQVVDPPLISGVAAAVLETAFDCIFSLELLARLLVNPAPRVFFLSAFNAIDLLTPAVLIVRVAVGFEVAGGESLSASAVLLLCFTPILRLMKMLRRWATIHLLTKAFIDVLEALPVLLFPLLALTLLFSTLIYVVEPRDNIPTMAKAVWLTMVTMTTVGYGDVTPTSVPGSFVVGILVISSAMYMAMPVAILGSSFTAVWQDRDTVMLLHRTKERLLQWGYSVHDIPVLFTVFDKDSTGELNVKEFVRMIKTMKLGLTDEQIFALFKAFDGDGSGEIDDKEFVRVLFPNKYVEVYGTDEDGDGEVDIFGPRE